MLEMLKSKVLNTHELLFLLSLFDDLESEGLHPFKVNIK